MNPKTLAATAAWLPALALAASAEEAPAVKVTRIGAQASTQGAAEYFSGAVRIDSPFKGSAPARVSGATVTFEPGARTAWHTHPLGQTLIVIAGLGWVQHEPIAGAPAYSGL